MIDTNVATEPQRPPYGAAIIVFAMLLLGVGLPIWALRTPAPIPADGPETAFSAHRAIQHDYVIATEPHPAGSPANDKVAAYIVDTMLSYGVDTELVSELYVRGRRAGQRDMIVAHIPGTANTKAFALMAHYDSTPYGPGAADDCGGVIAMIETARALKVGPPLMNDVLFVFTDGEEGSKLGSHAFADSPWFDKVAVLTNLEARGTKGNSMMFGTVDRNGWLIRNFIEATRYPCASSLGFDVYKRMPFSTDFDELRPLGMKGFDIAFTDNFAWYHTMNDTPEHLDLGTLQHHGSYALDLARHFGNIPLDGNLEAPDLMYFNTLGYRMVRYPLAWGTPLAGAAAVMVLIVLVVAVVRKHASIGGIIAGILLWPLGAGLSAAVSVLLLALIWGPDTVRGIYLENFTRIPDLDPMYHNKVYIVAFAAATTALMTLLYGTMCRWMRAQSLVVGALLWWTAAMIALAVYLPGGSYLLMWPLAIAAAGLMLYVALAPAARMRPGWIVMLTITVLPAFILCIPFYWSIGYTVTVLAAPGLAVFAALLLGLAIPQIDLMARVNLWWVPLLSGAVAVGLVAFGMLNSNHTPERPKLNSVSYAINYDTNEAFWLSPDAAPDAWTEQFFDAAAPRESYEEIMASGGELVMKAPAPIAHAFPGPEIAVLHDSTTGDMRELVLQVTSPAQAAQLDLRLDAGVEVFESSVLGKPFDGGRDGWGVRFVVFPKEGAEVLLRVRAGSPVRLLAREEFYGLPEIPGFEPRPAWMIPTPNTVNHRGTRLPSNHIWVLRSFEW